jgi:hypothetical protein
MTPMRYIHRGTGDAASDACAKVGGVMFGNPPHCTQEQFVNTNMPDVQMIGACPVQDLSRNMCMLANGNQVGCNTIRECDSLTGARHGEYGLPSPTGNVDMPIVTPGSLDNNNPAYSPLAAPPGLAQQATPTYSLRAGQDGSVPVMASGAPVSSQSTNTPVLYAGGSPGGPISKTVNLSPTTQQIAAAAGSSTVPSGTVNKTAPPLNSSNSNSSDSVSTSIGSWFTDSSIISSVPNWLLLAGVLGLGYVFLMGGKKMER